MTGSTIKALGCPVSLHPDDLPIYHGQMQMMRMFGMKVPVTKLPDVEEHKADTTFKVGSYEGRIIHTPGHSPGSCCFVFPEFVVTGDTLFKSGFDFTTFLSFYFY